MAAKEIHRAKLISYLGEPGHDFVKRSQFPKILGIKQSTFYCHFTSAEMDAIELEAFELRKRKSVRDCAAVYNAMLRQAKRGSLKHAKEYLDRIEGKVTDRTEVSGPGGGPIETRDQLVTELLQQVAGATRGLPKPRSDKKEQA